MSFPLVSSTREPLIRGGPDLPEDLVISGVQSSACSMTAQSETAYFAGGAHCPVLRIGTGMTGGGRDARCTRVINHPADGHGSSGQPA